MALSLSSISIKDGSGGWNNLLDLIYPVGSLHISREPTSPATLFGGSWFQLSDVLIAAEGPNMGDVNTGGDTSPAGSFYIGVNNMPSHSHAITINRGGQHQHDIKYQTNGQRNGTYWQAVTTNAEGTSASFTNLSGAHTHTATCANVGEGQRYIPYHANFYMWRRIS